MQTLGKMRVGDVSGGNYAEFEADGTLKFVGNATVWEDLRVPLERGVVSGANVTSWEQIGSTGLYAWNFDDGEEIWFSAQMPHSWKIGSTIYPHLHWMPESDVSPADNIKINLLYAWCSIDTDFAASAPLSRDVPTGINNALHHLLHNFSETGISGAGQTLSSVLVCKFYRSAADTDNYAGGIFALEIDFHYEIDTVGSRLTSEK